MYFFAVVFLLLAILFLNSYSKKNPVEKDKISHEIKFSKELCEIGEEFVLSTEIKNSSTHPMGRIYLKQTIDEAFELVDDKKYKTEKVNDNKKSIICRTFIKSKNTCLVETKLKVSKRGLYNIYGTKIDYFDFSGFRISNYDKESYGKVVIVPQKVDKGFLSMLIAQGYGDFNAKRGFIDDETTIRSYGEYTGHEPMRHINWKKSAQVGDFVVKQFEPMGTQVTTIVFDISGFANAKEGTKGYKLMEYCISMLREIFEYFEAKRISYCFYTNAKSSLIENNTFFSKPSGLMTQKRMLTMLGELSYDFPKNNYMGSTKLLDFAIKNSFRAPFTYIAPINRSMMTTSLKKLIKIKGIEIVELYAERFCREKEEEKNGN